MPAVLTAGEWEALLYQTPDQVKALVLKLAAYHGHIAPTPEACPLCNTKREPEQMNLDHRKGI